MFQTTKSYPNNNGCFRKYLRGKGGKAHVQIFGGPLLPLEPFHPRMDIWIAKVPALTFHPPVISHQDLSAFPAEGWVPNQELSFCLAACLHGNHTCWDGQRRL